MCHLLLLMPILALPLFWVAPPVVAIPVYLLIVVASALLYWVVWRSMRRPLGTIEERLMGGGGKVLSRLEGGRPGEYLVRAADGVWTAHSAASLQPGDAVRVSSIRGVCLVVEPAGPGQDQVGPVGKADCH